MVMILAELLYIYVPTGQDTSQDKHLLLMEGVHYLISQEDEINYI